MTKKLLLFMCILMNLTCMMLAALLFSLRNQGRAVLILGQSINPTAAIFALLAFAVLFVFLATKLFVAIKRK